MTDQSIIELTSTEFPPALMEIPEPPKKLFLQGAWPGPGFLYLTVVGARRLSTYGREVTQKLITALTGESVVIVSGLAIGIDTIAHQTALACGLKTLAIPGSGLDRTVLHPPGNRRLADEILERGGALLSELEPGEPAGIHTFPRRNRLMAGLAQAVMVIEAGEKSGTLITARLAVEYNRDVFAVPGSIFSPNSAGANQLLRQGATPITGPDDLREALGLARRDRDEATGSRQLQLNEFSPSEQKLLGLLQVENQPRDEIIRALGGRPSEINVMLAALELRGIIVESGGEFRLV
ncbi:MAG: DNA-processing protein DprA [Patescibacteria group bacterium]